MKLSHTFKIIFVSLMLVFGMQSFAKSNSPLADGVITSKIKGKIALDQSISVFNIGVTTNNGIVYLDGVVDSDSQAEALFDIVQDTDGVRNINADGLAVKDSHHPIKDTYTTAKVKGLLVKKRVFQNSNVPLEDVHVETNNGVVYLTGTAKSRVQVDKAIKVAKSVNGVKRVESRLEITR